MNEDIEFEKKIDEYSNEELEDISLNIDKEKYPLEYKLVIEKLKKHSGKTTFVSTSPNDKKVDATPTDTTIRSLNPLNIIAFVSIVFAIINIVMTSLILHNNAVNDENSTNPISYLFIPTAIGIIVGVINIYLNQYWAKYLLIISLITTFYLSSLFFLSGSANNSLIVYKFFLLFVGVSSLILAIILASPKTSVHFKITSNNNKSKRSSFYKPKYPLFLLCCGIVHFILFGISYLKGITFDWYQTIIWFSIIFISFLSSLLHHEKDYSTLQKVLRIVMVISPTLNIFLALKEYQDLPFYLVTSHIFWFCLTFFLLASILIIIYSLLSLIRSSIR
jgi:hypothetical protein